MIDEYEIDPDGFAAEIDSHAEELRAEGLTYDQLLMVAARALAEAAYNEGVYYCDVYELRAALHKEMFDPDKVSKAAAIAFGEKAANHSLSALGRKAALARHAEDNETAERIRAWYAENHHRFKSMDAAAEAAARIEPVSFRTARKHIGAAAKTLPSARKE